MPSCYEIMSSLCQIIDYFPQIISLTKHGNSMLVYRYLNNFCYYGAFALLFCYCIFSKPVRILSRNIVCFTIIYSDVFVCPCNWHLLHIWNLPCLCRFPKLVNINIFMLIMHRIVPILFFHSQMSLVLK